MAHESPILSSILFFLVFIAPLILGAAAEITNKRRERRRK